MIKTVNINLQIFLKNKKMIIKIKIILNNKYIYNIMHKLKKQNNKLYMIKNIMKI